MDILELIPQRPPMVLVDTFEGIDAEGVARTTLEVRSDNLFLEDDRLTECGLTEHIAQSAAARIGYLFRKRGDEVPIGFIGSVNNLVVEQLPAVGMRLYTAVRVVQEVFNVTLIEAETATETETVARCKMKIFLQQ
mgnify:FL=1